MLVNLDDTIQSLRLLTPSGTSLLKHSIMFSTYATALIKHSTKCTKISSSLETFGVYINIEHSIKKKPNLRIVSNEYLGNAIFRTLYSFNALKSLYCTFTRAFETLKTSSNFIRIIIEFLYSPTLEVHKLKSKFNLFIFNPNCYFLFSYPDKTLSEDGYRSTIDKKNSLTMLECSRNERKQSSNFFI